MTAAQTNTIYNRHRVVKTCPLRDLPRALKELEIVTQIPADIQQVKVLVAEMPVKLDQIRSRLKQD